MSKQLISSSSVPSVISIIEIGLFIAFLIYLDKLEKIGCECALTWHRKFIIVFVAFALIWSLISAFAPMKNKALSIALTLFRVAFIVIAIQYVNKLKKEKCECSKEWTRDVMYYYAWVSVILVALSFALIAWAFALAYSMLPKQ